LVDWRTSKLRDNGRADNLDDKFYFVTEVVWISYVDGMISHVNSRYNVNRNRK